MTQVVTQPIPPVPSAQSLDGKALIISQPWQQWFVNLREKVNQINSVVVNISAAGTNAAAFDLLSPLTTAGDILIYNGGHNVRVPVGSNGQILSVVSGLPAWVNPSAGSTPLTTKGDILGYSTTPTRVPVGIDGQFLQADSTNPNGVSYITPPTNYVIPTFSNVSTLLHFNGINGSTTFTDQVVGNTWTATSATISTTQSLFGGSSGLFTGASFSSISLPTNNGFNIASGDWTLEFSIYVNGAHQTSARIFQTRNGDVYSAISLTVNSTSAQLVQLYMSSNGTSFDVLNGANIVTLSTGVWTRILIQRAGGTLLAYVNGFLLYTTSISGSLYYNSADSIIIGGNTSGTSRSINAYLDEFRFTKGQALVHSYITTTSEFPNS